MLYPHLPDPLPSLVAAPRREAHRLADVELENVESICPTYHLGKQAAVLIPDPEDTMFTTPFELLLIELAEADNVGGEARDVVHPLERLMLPIFAL
jgi:hypothetical protein